MPDNASQRGDILEPLLSLTRDILQADELETSMQRIAETACEMFGFRLASIVAASEPGGQLYRRAIIGFDEATTRARIGEQVERERIEKLLRPEFLAAEHCYYVPMEKQSRVDGIPMRNPEAGPPKRLSPEFWHPRDALTMVLPDSDGMILGYLTIDDPVDGKIPRVESMRHMQLFLNLAGLALSNARLLREQETRMTAQAEALEATQKLLLETKNAITDPLTGIANRRAFDETLKAEMKRASRSGGPLALALIDIDHFKAFNDRYGHVTGDECLKRIANVLVGNAKRPEDLVARYGGEEFAFVLPGTDVESALDLVEHVREAVLQERIEHADSSEGILSISAGVAAVAPETIEPQVLVQAADEALYRAKKLGRNRVSV